MRYKQLLSEEQLDELRMSPSSLRAFASSPEAQGIRAGFEAELVFTGMGGEPEYDEDPEPDMDADERCHSIQQVIDFFTNDEYGWATYGRELDKLQEALDEKYYEWHDEQMQEAFRDEAEELIKKLLIDEGDWELDAEIERNLEDMGLSEDEIAEAIKDGENAGTFNSSKEEEAFAYEHPGYQRYSEAREQAEGRLDDMVQDSLSSQDKNYDAALDDFRDSFYIDDDSGFFTDVGLRWMSDIADEFGLNWPVMNYTGSSSEGGWSDENAERLADDLHEKLGVRTKVSSGYHSAKRDNETWIFEPDSSLDADDSENMSVEIVSPPMPLEECLAKMEQFFEWAEGNGAYANGSTGFHMGVSLPQKGGDVDYVKLALFLGDEHVLKEFGRSSNHFCEAAMKKIRNRVKGDKERVSGALELMRHNLIELAQKSLEVSNQGFGKYTSINPQGGVQDTDPTRNRSAKYIEFRSAGGTNYFEDIGKLQNTLMRYAKAMHVASRPDLERKEYYKKLYKLIAPPEGDPAIDLFAQFAAGEISSADLKKQWADKQLEAEPKGDWKVYDANGKYIIGQDYHGFTKSEVWDRAKQKLSPGSSMTDFQKAFRVLPMQSQTGDWEVYNNDTGETLEILRGYPTKGAAADAVYDKYVTQQGIPFNLRPADPESPEKPLSQREKLAKNIKQAPPEEIKNWRVYDTKTGETHYEQEGRKSSLVQIMRKFERDHKLPQGQLAIKEIPLDPDKQKQDWDVVYTPTGRVIDTILKVDKEQAEKLLKQVSTLHDFENADNLEIRSQSAESDPNDVRTVPRKWEFYRTETGNVIDTVDNINMMQAEAVRKELVRRYGHPDDSVRMRSVPTAASAERARARIGNPEPANQIDPVDYNGRWEILSPEGEIIRHIDGSYNDAENARRQVMFQYENPANVTARPAPQQTYSTYADAQRAANTQNNVQNIEPDVAQNFQQPQQATAPNGVPMWQVYERDSGRVVHEFADHTQPSAWQQAQTWLRNIGAEDPSLFSCRPKMTTVSESKAARIWESILDDMVKPVKRWI